MDNNRAEAYEGLMSEIDKMPSVIELLDIYDGFDSAVIKGKAYLDAFQTVLTSSSSNSTT